MRKILAFAVAILLVGCVTVVDDTSKEKKNYTLDLPARQPAKEEQPSPALLGENASGGDAASLALLMLIAQSGKNSSLPQSNLSQYAQLLEAMQKQFGNNSTAAAAYGQMSPQMLEALAKLANGSPSPGASGADWQKLLNMTKR